MYMDENGKKYTILELQKLYDDTVKQIKKNPETADLLLYTLGNFETFLGDFEIIN